MNEETKKLVLDLCKDVITCSTDTIYESLAMLFGTMAAHPELSLQEVLISIAAGLRMLVSKENN